MRGLAKYKILRCHRCGALVHYAKGIRTTCTNCGKKLDPKKSFIIAEYGKPGEAVYVEQRVKEEMAKERCEFEKKANYINKRSMP